MNNTDIMRKYADILDEGFGIDPLRVAAEENVEKYLGDISGNITDPKELQDTVWSLAHDGAMDTGAAPEAAARVADLIAAQYGE